MGRGWRPLIVGGAVVAGTFALAQAQIFAPPAPAGSAVAGGDVDRGETIFRRECSGCHGAGADGGIGPALAGTGLDVATVLAIVRNGRGVMPAGLVSGQDEADVATYVVSISSP
jgi:mono/diheme cytochrome c family protein